MKRISTHWKNEEAVVRELGEFCAASGVEWGGESPVYDLLNMGNEDAGDEAQHWRALLESTPPDDSAPVAVEISLREDPSGVVTATGFEASRRSGGGHIELWNPYTGQWG